MHGGRRRTLMIKGAMVLGAFLLLVCIVFGIDKILEYRQILITVQSFSLDEEKMRRFDIDPGVLEYYIEEQKTGKLDAAEEVALHMMALDYKIPAMEPKKRGKITERLREKLKNRQEYKELYGFYKTLLADIVYFPVPNDLKGHETVGFDNSWGGKRTYGGERRHEGCDVMTSNNKRGYFPIVSITDGVVENKGWLKLGGYRIGIRSKSGCYYYYAHLFSYADGIEIGDTIKAGELLGFMGDTGYSDIEGSTGNFDVHLHMGLYVTLEGKEVSVNPYPILKYLEKKKLSYYF